MATIKSFTSLEQSKKLAEILPLESADAFYVMGDEPVDIAVIYGFVTHKHLKEQVAYKRAVPCWSLSALLGLMPIECKLEKTLLDQSDYFTYAYEWTGEYRTFEHNDPIDAAFEMVCWLKENNKI